MVWSPLSRIRSVLGARLHLLQAQYEAATRTLELRPSIDRLESITQSHNRDEMLAQRQELAELRAAVAQLQDLQSRHLRLSRAHYDGIGGLREKLIALRRSDAYAATFENRHPLVSVPIATYNAGELLVERAIASVRAQTYDRWEIVVVGDGCTDDTPTRLERLGDQRIRFLNLPFRTVSVDDPRERWLVSGAAPWNRAVELCRGEWIAPLDDDDVLLPHHMETLLDLALEHHAEYVYGTLAQDGGPDLFSFPPEYARTGMQAALYLRALDFFECDIYSWAMEEPIDWNVIRRMRAAGVHMEATDQPVARYYPSRGDRM
jgi:Glycosyl transferase family 2